jgi:hypothetical protein
MGEPRDAHAVEADDPEVLGHLETEHVQPGDDAQGDDVRGRNDRPPTMPVGDDPVDRLLPPLDAELAEVDGSVAEVLGEVLVALMPRGRASLRADVEDRLLVLVDVLAHMPTHQLHPDGVVTAHGGDVGVDDLTVELDRQGRLGSPPDRLGAAELVAGDDHDRVDLAPEERLHTPAFDPQIVARAEDQHIGRGPLEGRGQVLGEGGEEGIVQVGDEQADGRSASLAQRSPDEIGLVTEGGGCAEDDLTDLRRHRPRIAEDPGDGRPRHSGPSGDVGDRHPSRRDARRLGRRAHEPPPGVVTQT